MLPNVGCLLCLVYSSAPTSPWEPGLQHILERHFNGILYKHLDLQIRAQLFQYGLLTDEQVLNIARLAENTSDIFSTASLPNTKREALRVLVDALKFAGDCGFMGLIAVLRKAAKETNGRPSSHSTVLDTLKRDDEYSVIKQSWLSSLTMFD